ncbi:hypothetical protein FA95DRAFT_1569636 [Auriscalpium vulgare]|uniref:Uncharacterized protein n=1 Tax=Auriscalpium vulgare TaxID=40419 RepID=A0ACB8S777_9AGAM|nr:hypothetical protein FA95DRAFT_1569636 [Auriscalpium vulgare]
MSQFRPSSFDSIEPTEAWKAMLRHDIQQKLKMKHINARDLRDAYLKKYADLNIRARIVEKYEKTNQDLKAAEEEEYARLLLAELHRRRDAAQRSRQETISFEEQQHRASVEDARTKEQREQEQVSELERLRRRLDVVRAQRTGTTEQPTVRSPPVTAPLRQRDSAEELVARVRMLQDDAQRKAAEAADAQRRAADMERQLMAKREARRRAMEEQRQRAAREEERRQEEEAAERMRREETLREEEEARQRARRNDEDRKALEEAIQREEELAAIKFELRTLEDPGGSAELKSAEQSLARDWTYTHQEHRTADPELDDDYEHTHGAGIEEDDSDLRLLMHDLQLSRASAKEAEDTARRLETQLSSNLTALAWQRDSFQCTPATTPKPHGVPAPAISNDRDELAARVEAHRRRELEVQRMEEAASRAMASARMRMEEVEMMRREQELRQREEAALMMKEEATRMLREMEEFEQ